MRKSLTYKILAAVMAAGSLGLYAAAPAAAEENFNAPDDGTTIVNGTYDNVYGNGTPITITAGTIGYVYGAGNDYYDEDASGGNVTINGNAKVVYVYGGYSRSGSANDNTVKISGGTIGSDDWSAYVYGGYSESGSANDNIVNISGGTIGEANDMVNIYGGYISNNVNNNTIDNNEVVISGSAVIENANLYGSNISNNTGNTLTINGWSGKMNSVQNFNDIAFKNINWQNGNNVLTITTGSAADLDKTTIDTIHIAGGSNINVGESMKLIESEKGNDLGLTEGNVTDTFTAGVAREGLGSTSVDGNGNVTFKLNSIKLSSQAESAAQTRAASAAFVNQGTDLISDSLDTISRDDNYGVKTFAAVHGNRSKYDVADDIKINGWSTIVGVGNADKFDNGSEFSWGVFYELRKRQRQLPYVQQL